MARTPRYPSVRWPLLALAALADVDYVTVFAEETPAALVAELRPDVLVKGEDWKEKGVVGRETVEAAGGHVVLAPLVPGRSSSDILRRAGEGAREVGRESRGVGGSRGPIREARRAGSRSSEAGGNRQETRFLRVGCMPLLDPTPSFPDPLKECLHDFLSACLNVRL